MQKSKLQAKNQNWKKYRLDNLLELIIDHRGKTPKKLGGHWSNKGVPTLSAKNIKGGQIINEKDIRCVDQELYDRWMPEKLEKGDILLTSEAPLGELLYLKEKADYCLSQRLFALRVDKNKLYPKYLYYYLTGQQGRHELLRRISGTAAEGIRQSELVQIEVTFPQDFNEQKRIADILSAFDEKIELNNKINQTLEEMASAIFKEWFVKFKFPGYEKVKFVDSELGKIPEGWKVKKIKDVAKINKGLSYASSEISDTQDGIPMINLANFKRGGGFLVEGIKYYKGEYRESNLVKPGDVVIAMTDLTSNREVIGHPARVPAYRNWDRIVISLDACSLKTNELYVEFLYYLMFRKEFSYLMASSAGGTNVAHLSKSLIEDYSFVLPEKHLIERFHELIKPIFIKQNNLAMENQKLATLRDLLLPKLMSGEVRV